MLLSALMLGTAGCAGITAQAENTTETPAPAETATEPISAASTETVTVSSDEEYFTERDLEQTADLTDAVRYTVSDGNDITIDAEGVYVLSGTAKNAAVIVDAADDAKVQLVLDGLNITNTDSPCIYVKNADKVFVTLTGDSTLAVSGAFTADGETNTDAVIFSKDDLVLNGTGSLTVTSSDNGITSKDDLKITGGTYVITADNKALEANDSIRIADGTFTIKATDDGMHAENDDDDSVGFIYIADGDFTIDSDDDAIHATTTLVIDGGTFKITGHEGLEATAVTLSGGDITISASDDGINAGKKSSAVEPAITITGGNLNITMGSGDTDAIDSNGSITITGGTIEITAQSPFDYDGKAEYTGGTIIVNGQTVNSISNQMMGGFGRQGMTDGQMPAGGGMFGNGEMTEQGGMPAEGGQFYGRRGGMRSGGNETFSQNPGMSGAVTGEEKAY